MADNIVVVFERAVREPVVAHELPDIFDRIELGAFGRQRHYGDVWWYGELARQVPAGLIHQQCHVAAGCHTNGDFSKMQAHHFRVAAWQDQPGRLALHGADRAKDIG